MNKRTAIASAMLAGLGTVFAVVASSGSHSLVVSAAVPSASRSVDTAAMLGLLGLPGDQLLVAGFTSPQILAAAHSLMDNGQLVDALIVIRGQVEQLRRERQFIAEAEMDSQLEALHELNARLIPLQTQLESSRTLLRGLVLNSATEEQRRALDRISVGLRHGLSLELAVAAESDRAAIKLAAAIREETRATRTGEQISDTTASLLATTRARPDVAAAQSSLAAWQALRQSLSQTSDGEQGR